MPSSEVSAHSSDEPEGLDSGFSDSGATPTLSEDSQDVTMSKMITAQDEDAILEDAADLNLPKTEEQPDGQEQITPTF